MINIDSMKCVFVQEFYDDCPESYIFGTEEYPVYLCGYSNRISKYGYFSYYDEKESRNLPGIITPNIITRFHINPEFRINLMLGNKFLRNILIPDEGNMEYLDDYKIIRIKFTFK